MGHGSSHFHDDEKNALSAANGLFEPPETNPNDGRLGTSARIPSVVVSAQTPMERIPGSSSDETASKTATIRSRLRSARVPKPGSEVEVPIVVKKGMSMALI